MDISPLADFALLFSFIHLFISSADDELPFFSVISSDLNMTIIHI
jgi:hypothetical protein